jgi:hypothetical protein
MGGNGADLAERAEAIATAEETENLIAELDAIVLRSIAERREASIEAGRAFNKLRRILGHGKWQRHFQETFSSKITLRTAERWMGRAKRADSDSKTDAVSIFKPASDEHAKKIRRATREAEAEVEGASRDNTKDKTFRHIHNLPLRMTSDEHEWTLTLQKLPKWNRAEGKILRLLKELWIKYGIVGADDPRLA